MAADMVLQVLVSPLLGTVFNNLSSLIKTEFCQVWGVKRELEKLSRTMSTIQDVMEDAEDKQLQDKPLNNWLKRLKEVVYDAEDVLEEFAIEAAVSRNRHSISSHFDFKHVLFRRKIAKKIKDLREKFDEIAKDRSNFHLNLNSEKKHVRFAQTSSIPIETQVYGRDKDKQHLVNLLLNNIELDGGYQGGDVSIYTIHGMGGLGKTTLARMVHNDERIVKHFDVRCWVYVSENFDPIMILKAIIGSLDGSHNDIEDLDTLQRRLQEKLSGKRFLVVLDDVWNDDQAKWDTLNSSLRCGNRGSSVLVTTCLETVASIMGTLHMYSLTILSDEDCWPLFKHRAFGITNDEVLNYPNLEAIGKDIVKKCKGVPLAAKSLGGLLRFRREENEWIFVRDSEVWNLPQHTQDAILPALKLSYIQLQSNLKQCFAYCSIFPKGHRINKNELVNLWIANGFIQSRGESMDLEDVGNEIFNDLLWRSFFQNIEKDEFDNIKWCFMHDLLHDLACSIMGGECLVLEAGKVVNIGQSTSRNTIRHLSFDSSYSLSPILDESSLPDTLTHIRTFLSFRKPYKIHSTKLLISLQLIFSNFKWLRILDLSYTRTEVVPDSIRNLKHLRYLDLSRTLITSLPNEPFCSLRNLQILRLRSCHKLQMLPEDLRKLSSLRHLDIETCKAITQMPIGLGKLTCLRSLSRFIVGPETGYGIEELQGLDHLGGELKIEAMEHVRRIANARNANLIRKHNLTSLELFWSRASPSMQQDNSIIEEDELLLGIGEGLQPHPNIKNLQIEGYQGPKFPNWMGSYLYLPNLVKIDLIGCRRCEHLPPLGELPLLKFLHIAEMDSVKCIGQEFYHGDHHHHHHHQGYFPSLVKLEISNMENLEEWSSPSSSTSNQENRKGGGNEGVRKELLAFPCLQEFDILKCVKLRSCPSLSTSLQTLRLSECHEMIIARSFENLTSLKSLTIESCHKLRTLPRILMESLTAVSKLIINGCKDLVCLLEEGMQNLKYLEVLVISGCDNLKTLGEGFIHLTSLKVLEIFFLPTTGILTR